MENEPLGSSKRLSNTIRQQSNVACFQQFFSHILISVLFFRNHLFVFVMKVQLTLLHRGLGITRDLLITRIPSLIVLQLIVLPWVAPSGHCHPTMVCFFRSTFLFLVPDPHIRFLFYVFVDFIVFIYLFLSSRSIVFYKVSIFFTHLLVLIQKKVVSSRSPPRPGYTLKSSTLPVNGRQSGDYMVILVNYIS